jgi:hypothetical protein
MSSSHSASCSASDGALLVLLSVAPVVGVLRLALICFMRSTKSCIKSCSARSSLCVRVCMRACVVAARVRVQQQQVAALASAHSRSNAPGLLLRVQRLGWRPTPALLLVLHAPLKETLPLAHVHLLPRHGCAWCGAATCECECVRYWCCVARSWRGESWLV